MLLLAEGIDGLEPQVSLAKSFVYVWDLLFNGGPQGTQSKFDRAVFDQLPYLFFVV